MVKEDVSFVELIRDIAILEYVNKGELFAEPQKSEIFKNAAAGMDEKTTELLADEYKKQYEKLINTKPLPRVSIFEYTDEARDRLGGCSRFLGNSHTYAEENDYELIYTQTYTDGTIPNEVEILRSASDRTIKPENHYGHSLREGDIISITFGDSSEKTRFFRSFTYTNFPADLAEPLQRRQQIGLDIRKEFEIIKSILDAEIKTNKEILTVEYRKRYQQIEKNFSIFFKAADLRAKNPVTYKDVQSLKFLYPGDIVFKNYDLYGIEITDLQKIEPFSDTKYVGYSKLTGEEIKFTFREIYVLHHENTVYSKESGDNRESKRINPAMEKSEEQINNKVQKTKSEWKAVIEEAKQNRNSENLEKESIISKNDKTR